QKEVTVWACMDSGSKLWLVIFGFFFSSRRRHTRFSRDWSSDVCSSDLNDNSLTGLIGTELPVRGLRGVGWRQPCSGAAPIGCCRSEERRVGKECRCRWSGCPKKRKKRRNSEGAHVR